MTLPLANGHGRAVAVAAALALAFGVVLAWSVFPLAFLVPPDRLVAAEDMAQHVLAQRYMIGDDWRWPPLNIPKLAAPEGSNLALLDGIPIVALLLKAFRAWLPANVQGITPFYVVTFALQPVAAVWALRGAGERCLMPLLAVGTLAASAPALWNRYGHAALTAHFTVLLALGLYLRLRRGPRPGLWVAAAALTALALLIHPYLMVMVIAVLTAVPLSAALSRAWAAAGWHAVGLGACGGVGFLILLVFGYVGATGGFGFGDYSMNLLSPVWPSGSIFFPNLAPVDAVGLGGWEGYNYLGAGPLLGLAAVLLLPGAVWAMLRRHAGLAVVLAGLVLLSLSSRIGVGSTILLDLQPVPDVMQQFRSSGRFFWPVGYALLLGMVLLLARLPGRLGPAALVAVTLLQVVDVAPLRARVAHSTRTAFRPPLPEATAFAPLLPGVRMLTLLPSWVCGAPNPADAPTNHRLLLDIIGLAATLQVPVSTVYAARWQGPPRCTDTEVASLPLRPGELRAFLPAGQGTLTLRMPGAREQCRFHGGLILCEAGGRPDLVPTLAEGGNLSFAGGGGLFALADGWAEPENWGVWSKAPRASLRFRVDRDASGTVLEWRVMGFGPQPGQDQTVRVQVNDIPVAEWTLPDQQVSLRTLVLPNMAAGAPLEVSFTIDKPTRPADRAMGSDTRALGVALVDVRQGGDVAGAVGLRPMPR